MYSTHSTW